MSEERIERTKERGQQNNKYYTTQPKLQGRPSKFRQQFSRGMSVFSIIAASIAFYFALMKLPHLSGAVIKVVQVLKPVIYGLVIAYLLNPIVKAVERGLSPYLSEKIKDERKVAKWGRTIGVIAALVCLVTVITILCNMLIPSLYDSIKLLVFTLPAQTNRLLSNINNILVKDTTMQNLFKSVMEEGTTMFQTWLRQDMLPQVNDLMSNLTVGVFNVVSEIFNMLIGVVISVYIMFSRETFSRQAKKFLYAVFEPRNANLILHITNKSNEIFGGFIIGKLIDSLIIGIICFFILTMLNMPYVLLISVIIGVTNVIPFFGPYIGAVPSALLVALTNPMKGLVFVVFIVILQQFDGNILGPKILGNSTGLSAFWVVVAILLGGGLFGFVGMLIGVPTFAVLYYMVDLILESKLERKHLPTDKEYYDIESYVDNEGNYVPSDAHIEKGED